MKTPLENYMALIDGLVSIRSGIHSSWVSDDGAYPDQPENTAINQFLASLNAPARMTLAGMLQEARESGIHDALAYLNDQIALEGFALVKDGVEIPKEPFGTELNYDWVCRGEGDEWPDSDIAP